MKEIKNLLKVKSIVTLIIMVVFVFMAVTDRLDTAVTASTITAVITYYFTKRETSE